MLRTIRVPAAAIIIVGIAMLLPMNRPLLAQTQTLALRSEPLTDTGPVGLRRAAEAAVERMNLAPVSQVAQTSADAPWARVRALASGASVEAQMADGRRVRGQVTGVSDDTLAVQTSRGPFLITRAEIRKIRVPDPSRRVLYGALGIGGGLLGGALVCPQCANEGGSSAPYMMVGALAGATALLISPYRTIYQTP